MAAALDLIPGPGAQELHMPQGSQKKKKRWILYLQPIEKYSLFPTSQIYLTQIVKMGLFFTLVGGHQMKMEK